MPALILPRRFTQQPQGAVEVDWSSPLARGLTFDFSAGDLRDRVSGALLTNSGSSPVATRHGIARQTKRASTEYVDCGDLDGFDVGDNFSIELLFRMDSGATGSTAFNIFAKDGAAGRSWAVEANTSLVAETHNALSLVWFSTSGSYRRKYTAPNSLVVGKWHHVILQRNGTATVEIWIDGVAKSLSDASNGSPTTVNNTTTPAYIGYRNYGTHYFDGAVAIARFRQGLLTSNDVRLLSENPWQIFRDPPRRVFYSLPASGVPTLSAAGMQDIAQTTARPFVTLTF